MKKRVLITGATGFVGYHLIQAALTSNLEVYINVRKSSVVSHLAGLDVTRVELDFESIYQLKQNIEENKYHYIIHAAATTKAKNREEYFNTNATYTRNLAVASTLSTHKIEKFEFLSSLAARGPLKNNIDNNLSNPVTNYGRSKALAETYLSQILNLPLIVFRPTAVYGPREKDIFILIKGINSGFELHAGKQEQQLSFIYVTDLAKVMIEALASDVVNKTYNLSDGNVYSKFSLAAYVRKALNKKPVVLEVPMPIIRGLAWTLEKTLGFFDKVPALNIDKVNEITAANWICDIDKVQKDLGFVPQYQLETGLNETIAWYKENKWL
ncbi:NAD-dependent epimerase/dehydratase family protein [Pedobacter petrophilus]|uniref:NAD-dependent epimerase/dehydratase family protein n=1 Tax=Pedobacter petrophilus TaxID=1908241 RepID=A0A7K0G0G3_9SPHI|nr:NAD(P)-dependent oxidoreductase [Pedobacter petrophilus]MRX76486.1 NAD-dependent epimerase/dehydratase family protein [Pedobacter petrophilus]